MNTFDGREPGGLVVDPVAATALQFSVAIRPQQYVQLDDVVVNRRQLPGSRRARSPAASHRGERSISTSRALVTVVDLHNLPDRA